MNQLTRVTVLMAGLALSSMRAVASTEVDKMSDIEVSEYAVRMSSVLEKIQHRQLCAPGDMHCVRTVFDRNGLSYDDKESVQKRLVWMVGDIF